MEQAGIENTGPYRVVHVVLSLNIGGLEMVVLDLVRLLDQSGFEPHVICLNETGSLTPRFEAMGVPVESVGASSWGRAGTFVRLLRRFKQLRPDVVHTHNMAPHFQGAIAARLIGVPVVVHTKHGRNYPDHLPSVLKNRFLSMLTDCIVPVSEDAAQVARQIERVPAAKLRVIHNGIDLGEFPESLAGRRRRGKHAITVARLHPIKDQATMLRAARLVVDVEPDFRLEFVGDGPARAELESLTDELGLRDHIQFTGFTSEVSRHLAEADVFLLTSVSEGISLTLLEAMATGLPVVATAVGGNPEIVVHGETGLLAPPKSPEAIAAAILQLIRDPETAGRMGQAGRRRVEEEFDLRRVVQKYESLYTSLLERHGRGRAVFALSPDAHSQRRPILPQAGPVSTTQPDLRA